MEKEALIVKDIEDWMGDEEKLKTLDRAGAEELMETWITDFHLV